MAEAERRGLLSKANADALGVFPSSKSVYRAFRYNDSEVPREVAAGVEALHVGDAWDRPTQFDPKRHVELFGDAEALRMPFGFVPFLCPSRNEMIALLMVSLAGGMECMSMPMGSAVCSGKGCCRLEGIALRDECWLI